MVVLDKDFFPAANIKISCSSGTHFLFLNSLKHTRSTFNFVSESFLNFAHAVVKMRIPASYPAVSKCQLHKAATEMEKDKGAAMKTDGELQHVLCWCSTVNGVDMSPGISSARAQVSLSDL